ncbi:MarR family winged helix-turn-helix transcriptional regulator [Streptomyces sp. 796.1]|uniref:MarR family winged helix-turn-helix transcriptional regulator n=1 Tax=Streptomyces sp. 796.1 TaxID=3163029 RepID=UPI0039C92A48
MRTRRTCRAYEPVVRASEQVPPGAGGGRWEHVTRSPAGDPSTPPSPALVAPRTGMLLLTAGRLMREEIDRALEARGLSLRHVSALGHLSREPGLSYSALARRAGVTAQSMQATVRQLERAGAVARQSPAGRGRTAELRVTARGRDMLSEVDGVLSATEEPLLAGLSAEERTVLAKGLHQVLSNGWRARRGTTPPVEPAAGPAAAPPASASAPRPVME